MDREKERAGSTAEDVIEVHVEEAGAHSWVTALLNTVSGSYGTAQFRFAALAPATSHRASDHRGVSATFPVMRAQSLDDETEPNAWVETARARLEELDKKLVGEGWQRQPGTGRHWWSRTYFR